MNGAITIRHAASIVGVVRTAPTDEARPDETEEERVNRDLRRRVAGALVEIMVEEAPQAFQRMVLTMLGAYYAGSFRIEANGLIADLDAGQLPDGLLAGFRARGHTLSTEARVMVKRPRGRWLIVDTGRQYVVWHVAGGLHVVFHPRAVSPAWQRRHPRVDHTLSQGDGVFFFTDLPPGEAGEQYRLRVSVPDTGTRYGVVETDAVTAPTRPDDRPATPARVDVELPVTRIHGQVVDDGGEPVAGARVRLGADTTVVRTWANGRYQLSRLLAGNPTLVVSAPGFVTFSQPVEALAAGEARQVDVTLQPASP